VRSDSAEPGRTSSDAGGRRFVGRAAALGLGGAVLLVAVLAPRGALTSRPTESPGAPAAESVGQQPNSSDTAHPSGLRFSPLSDAEAWALLPERKSGVPGPLPGWASVLVRTLPRTTAAMLELDHLHRTGHWHAPGLREQIRWAAARASRSAYGEAYALADLRAGGLNEIADRLAAGDLSGLPSSHRAAMAFAEKLTADPRSVTDAEVAALIDQLGERQVVAIVLALAYSHFQDRLVLALGLLVETGGPVPPLNVRFARRPFGIVSAPPSRRAAAGSITAPAPDGIALQGWRPLDMDQIRCSLNDQRSRRPRIRLPDADAAVNRWGLVGQTYQPELSTAWSNCTQAFGEEADQDPVFEQSIFWVVTGTKGCFY
jgi:alkylhydroperoxidase family enzyme